MTKVIELIKETKLMEENDEFKCTYFVEIDKEIISGSIYHNYDDTFEVYKEIIKNNGELVKREVLRETHTQ